MNNYGQATVPTGLTGVTAIAAGYYPSFAIKSDGTVVAWGADNLAQTDVPAGLSGVTAIAAGGDHSLALVSSAAATLTVSGILSAYLAGDAHSVTVTAKDQDGNVATGYRGTIHFTSSDPAAVLPANCRVAFDWTVDAHACRIPHRNTYSCRTRRPVSRVLNDKT